MIYEELLMFKQPVYYCEIMILTNYSKQSYLNVVFLMIVADAEMDKDVDHEHSRLLHIQQRQNYLRVCWGHMGDHSVTSGMIVSYGNFYQVLQKAGLL